MTLSVRFETSKHANPTFVSEIWLGFLKLGSSQNHKIFTFKNERENFNVREKIFSKEKYNYQFVEIDWTFIYIDGLWKQIKEK